MKKPVFKYFDLPKPITIGPGENITVILLGRWTIPAPKKKKRKLP